MSLEYIQQAYQVPATRGARVQYTGDCAKRGKPRVGTITGAEGAHIRVRMDGDSFSNVYHPTWEMSYLPSSVETANG